MSEAQQLALAIEALIAGRLQDLKLTPVELVRRCGYKNFEGPQTPCRGSRGLF